MNQETKASSGKEHEPPGHDIFCTPENSDVLSKVHYRNLNPTEREIRLLKIFPDSGSGFIECELLSSVKLADVHNQYRALSYSAGNPRNTNTIIVNGARCNVFVNLHHALTAVRHYWETHSSQDDFLLWVDQICINQFDLEERSHQVGFMREIYQSAQETLICLSVAETEGKGLRWAIELVPSLEQAAAIRRSIDSPADMETANVETQARPDDIIAHAFDRLEEEDFADGWVEFFRTLKSPWWERAWVFQEFIVSSRATFLSGRYSIGYDRFYDILEYIHIIVIHYHLLPNCSWEIQLLRLLQRFQYSEEDIEEVIDRAYNMIFAKIGWYQNTNLINLLTHTRNCRASDPRDKIFSVLGLASQGYGILPNYSLENNANKLLIETTSRIILHDDSLSALAYLDHPYTHNEQNELPSWVVNWMEKTSTSMYSQGKANSIPGLNKHRIKAGRADALFLQVPHPEDPDRNTTALEVWGIFLDDNIIRTPHRGMYRGSRGHLVVPDEYEVERHDELWILCGASEPFLLRRCPGGYQLVIGVQCLELRVIITTETYKNFIDEEGDLDTTKMERRRIRIY